jgi:hypothetical protein
VNSITSRIIVAAGSGATNTCSCRQLRNGPRTCSSTNRYGRSYSLIYEVIRHWIPKWRACQVTDSPGPSRPVVTPDTARSPLRRIDAACTPTSRLASKAAARPAGRTVVRSMRGTVLD